MTWLILGVATLASCVIVRRLPILEQFRGATSYARRSLRLIVNTAISDHWKERVLPRYAWRLARNSLSGFGLMLLALAPFIFLAGVDQLWPQGILEAMLGWRGFACIMAVAILYLTLVRFWTGDKAGPEAATVTAAGYTPLSRVLHSLALARPRQLEMLFDLESATAPPPPPGSADGRHVFVAGLARAGTTVLTRALHASGEFASLTYRDMPFVLAPNLWARLTGRSRREMDLTERAHGDGVLVDFDSPEALEEPFWRAFCGEDYIRADALLPHEVGADTLERYRAFVAHVLARHGRARYLAKNNNNLLRLSALPQAFPRALVLVPFREPLAQARSLQRQHARFAASRDPFVRDYMSWLVHHEFGQDHRPFVTGRGRPVGSPDAADYWMSLWLTVHSHLLAQVEAGGIAMVPVAYEDMCRDDGVVWRALCRRIGTSPEANAFTAAAAGPLPATSPEFWREAEELYGALRELSLDRLGLLHTYQVANRALA